MYMKISCYAAIICFAASAAPAGSLPEQDMTANARLLKDFTAFDPDYEAHRQVRIERTKALAQQVLKKEAAGRPTACSHQILFETTSLLVSTAHWDVVDRRLDALAASLDDPGAQARAESPDATTGLWGACYDEFYLKLYDTYDRREKAASDDEAPRPLPAFLGDLTTTDALAARLKSLSVSDVAHTGIDHEREYNDTLATLLQMIVRGKPENYQVDPKLRAALLDLVLHRLRNPQTGWWGESYVRDGHVEFIDDLSITFHVVSYLKGRVPDPQRVIDTLLATRSLDYPVGWLWKGVDWNHNNMDVATLFALEWAQATPAQRAQMSAEIARMLHWCLAQSLQADGSFVPALADGSIEDAEAYGTEFLARIGYFDKSRRFWTTQDFPESEEVRTRILEFVRKHQGSGGAGGDSYKGILETLGKN
jgi:hypothetical protein